MARPSRRAGAWQRALVLFALLLLALALPLASAQAHDFRPGLMQLSERPGLDGSGGSGSFDLRLVVPPLGSEGPIPPDALQPVFPEHCELAARELRCGERGLVGVLGVEGLERHPVDVIVDIRFADGTQITTTLGPDEPAMELAGAELRGAGAGAGAGVGRTYFVLGVEHILAGFDHLSFVLGLVLLVRETRTLLWTITAFTAAHSITLAASSLALFSLPGPPVEAGIALSIVLLARELALDGQGRAAGGAPRQSLSFRYPYLVAFGFGLLHGFGFAGALAEIGLPPEEVPLALLSFNLGVEAGQLLVVGVLLAAIAGGRALLGPDSRGGRVARGVAVWAMGAVAVAWTIERVLGWF